MELVDYLLALEQLRHEPRLRVRREIDPATLDCEIPPLVVVTLVENAINHGIARRPEGGELVITATRTGAAFEIVVQNPGRIRGDSDSHRVGLRNIRAQVALCFGPAVEFELTQDGSDTVTARLQVPCAAAVQPVAS
jgi:two-component system, LytTR family, sensor kinase